MADNDTSQVKIQPGQNSKERSRIENTIGSMDTEAEEANRQIQDDFYGDGGNADNSPIYAGNNTPAIKVNKEKE
ncbi:hypothetical protein [Bacillus sp. FJAT-27251]|uniref:hypothetical protein n=1 Tax=Bacillus sp. FJAT-27251 TaxID=1684142 RepID=UPI0006A7777E|nr:hypothetical protein [Bacillus sp. FJAT-27251]